MISGALNHMGWALIGASALFALVVAGGFALTLMALGSLAAVCMADSALTGEAMAICYAALGGA